VTDPNLFQPAFDEHEEQQGFAHRRARLGRQAGSAQLGASLYELEPGQAVCPYHWHAAEEEMLIVVSGRPSLRTSGGWRELLAGEAVAFATGVEGAHQVVNRSPESVRVLLLSESKDPEVCGYPDSRKFMADALLGSPGEISHMWRLEDAVDYYEGEAPPPAHDEG
jgi:uncharacterized cupin superfamily protein